jgi:hypothetical protein
MSHARGVVILVRLRDVGEDCQVKGLHYLLILVVMACLTACEPNDTSRWISNQTPDVLAAPLDGDGRDVAWLRVTPETVGVLWGGHWSSRRIRSMRLYDSDCLEIGAVPVQVGLRGLLVTDGPVVQIVDGPSPGDHANPIEFEGFRSCAEVFEDGPA